MVPAGRSPAGSPAGSPAADSGAPSVAGSRAARARFPAGPGRQGGVPGGRLPRRRLPRRRLPGRTGNGTGTAPRFGGGARLGGAGAGGGGGFLNASQSNPALTKLLQADAGRYTWAAATVNSNNAAGYQLASGEPIMAIGGFNGTDPAPTLAQFEKYVAEGKIHYFIASGGGGFGGFGGPGGARWRGLQ